MNAPRESILIIRHGALGDIVLTSAHIKAIRSFYPNAHIVCLTNKPWAPLLSLCPWIDEVWIDMRPRGFNIGGWLRLIRLLRRKHFTRIFDLQTSERSALYWWFVRKPVMWSGIGRFVSHPQKGEERHRMHTIDRLSDQLAIAGIRTDGMPDISWLMADITHYGLPERFALLVAGGSAHRPEKRWPAEHYAALAEHLVESGITPVLLGTAAEAQSLAQIAHVDGVINLCDHTSFSEIAGLARHAVWAVGNDTGPMHVIAAAGCPSTVIFSHASDPAKSAPRGAHVQVVRQADLAALIPEQVWATRPARA